MPIRAEGAEADSYVPTTHAKPTLADLLTIESSASIFFTYARETGLSPKLTDENTRWTIFVPTNRAVMALARKPHQGPDSGSKLSPAEFDERTKRNVERWISAHIVPEYPLSLDTTPHKTLLEGKSISFVQLNEGGSSFDWENVALDNHSKIVKKKEGSNGDLYIIEGVISVEE